VQIGWGEVFVLRDAFADGDFEAGHERPLSEPFAAAAIAAAAFIDAAALAKRLEEDPDTLVLDLQPSTAHRRAHVPGARFAIRARLARKAAALPARGRL
jgi:hypothetical protein